VQGRSRGSSLTAHGRRVTIVVPVDQVEEITRGGQSKGIKMRKNAFGFRSDRPKSSFLGVGAGIT
jgi:hypothetical protein